MANTFKAKTLLSRTGIFSYEVIGPNLVYNTGDQTIFGNKIFIDNIETQKTGTFDALSITNKKFTSYAYHTGNFSFNNNYINFANSSTFILGQLPNEIISGINYYAKNLNTGILSISGLGDKLIDGFLNLNLYKNDSVQLVGINNIGYTGWVTISANGGIS